MVGEDGAELPQRLARQTKRQNADNLRAWLEEHAKEENELRHNILSIHTLSPKPESVNEAARSFETPPPEKPTLSRVGFFARSFRKKKAAVIEASNAAALARHKQALVTWETAKSNFEKSESDRVAALKQGLLSNASVVEEYFAAHLATVDWPLETLVNYTVGCDISTVDVDIDMPEIEDIPCTQSSVPKTQLRLSRKNLTQKQIRLDYACHIHGVLFGITAEAFAALPSVNTVVVNGYSQRTEASTGNISDEYLLSVEIQKADWVSINFDNLDAVDPVEALARFRLVRNMTKSGILKCVKPLSGPSESASQDRGAASSNRT